MKRKTTFNAQFVPSPCVQASKLWASLAYQGRNSGSGTSGLDSKGSSPFASNTPATKPNPVRLVPETPASFGASVIARSKAQAVKVKPRRMIKRPSSLSSSSSSSSSATTSDSELDPPEKTSSPLVISHGSFVAFMDEQRPAAAAAHPSASAKELVSILNAQWRQLTPQQQQRYVNPSLKVCDCLTFTPAIKTPIAQLPPRKLSLLLPPLHFQ